MNPQRIKELCLSLPGSTFDLKVEWEAELSKVGDKIYAMLGTDNKNIPVLTLKAHPETCIDLKLNYPSWITSGYYMNKTHWISIHITEPRVETNLVETLIQDSYNLIFSALPKGVQHQISSKE